MRKTEIIASIIGLLLSFATYWGTLYFPKFPIYLAGPEFYPQLLSILLGGLSIALLIQTLVKKKPRREPVEDEGGRGPMPKEKIFWKMVMAMAASVLYFLGMGFFGFLICTFLYFGFLMLLMQSKKKILKTIIWSSANTIVTYLIFAVALKASLPMGSIFR